MRTWRIVCLIAAVAAFAAAAYGQDQPLTAPQGAPPSLGVAAAPRSVAWQEGTATELRVPVVTDERKLMTTVALPEEGVESAISGFSEADISLSVKKALVFLRLLSPVEGEMTIIGSSGKAYLFSIHPAREGDYDRYVKITTAKPAATHEKAAKSAGQPRGKPVGALSLIRAMRMGVRPPEGARVLRARKEIMLRSERIEIRLLYVYRSAPYVGRVYEVVNRTRDALSIDASRFRPAGEDSEKLVATGLKKNALPPQGTTRLYMVFWEKD